MTFIPCSLNSQPIHVYLKPRSMVFFTQEVRFKWKHSISERKIDRVADDLITRDLR